MSTIGKSVEVVATRATVYDQWTQFEEFPLFMQGWRRSGNSTTRVQGDLKPPDEA